MKTIIVDDDLFLEIDKLATGIFSHSDVIRKLYEKKMVQQKEPLVTGMKSIPPQKGSISAFVQSPEYRSLRKAGDRYLAVLGWVQKNRSNEFTKVENYNRGKRVYFAKSHKAILESGNGNIKAKQIPGSSVWTLVTLDSPSMRKILTDVLQLVGFQLDEIKVVVETIPTRLRGNLGDLFDGIV